MAPAAVTVFLVWGKLVNYSHKNLFHGGERFLLSMKGALEMQLLLTNNDSSSSQNSFNTVEWGPEVHFYIPKYF